MDAVSIIGTLLFSGVIAAYIASILDVRNEKRRQKFDIFTKLIGNRIAITEGSTENQLEKFYCALNSIPVVFHDNKKIIEILRQYHSDKNQIDIFVSLVEEMGKDLKIHYSGKNDDLIKKPFRPNL